MGFVERQKPNPQRRWIALSVVAVTLLLLGAWFWALLRNRGVDGCFLSNDQPLRNGYMGDIPPGGSSSRRILPRAEGGMTVKFRTADGAIKSVYADSYYDNRRGYFLIEIQNGKVLYSQYADEAHSGVEYAFDELMDNFEPPQ